MTAAGPDGVLAGWERHTFSAGGISHDTYRRGSGPGVIVVHEIPGITPLVARFANEVVDAGFTVVMPSLIGTPGKPASVVYGTVSMARLCISASSPIGHSTARRRSSRGCGPLPARSTTTSAGLASAPSGCASAVDSRWA